ncbi:TonB family protein [Ruficoccus amylovorans]|uniref:TonB family protein n=1 Tax=Ruficoccus amylovorans TaxID=1804625 RepID=A0A842HDD3_9BACT|nr:TonB family protein [Ruficoccus amylovorans]MBC2594209.1 TonB family protein [Ruficoccus amylovorans]
MRKGNTTRGFWGSVTVHVLFFGAVLLMIAWNRLHREPEPVIFELVEVPSEQPSQVQETPPTPEPDPAPEIPSIDAPQIAPSEPVTIPDINIPEPEPEPAPPPPAPTPTPTPTPTPKQEPAPKPKEQPKAKPMSIDDFRKQHGQPTPTPPKRNTAPTPAPKINVSDVVVTGPSTSSRQSSAAEQQALQNFIAQLRRQIELAWNKPEAATGRDTFAVVQVTVQPNGTLRPVVLVTPSGDRAFDNSILAAVKNARNIGGSPTGRAETIKYTFRMIDR